MANGTIKGRTTAGTGDPEDLTGAQATALLSNVTGDSGSGGVKGLVPAPAAGDAAAGKFLKADGTWATPSGGGGGGSLQWIEDTDAPIAAVEHHDRVYLFTPGLAQKLYARVKVPNSYLAGSQIRLRSTFYSPDNSGNALVQSVATLIRTGTDAVSSTTANQRTSTNAAVTLGAGTVDKPQAISLDLTDSSGQINGVAVSAGDLILVALQLGTMTATSDVRAPVYASEINFSCKKYIALLLIALQSGLVSPARAALSEADRAFLMGRNTLANPGAEASTAAFTASGGTLTTTTTAANIGSGNASFSWDSSAASQTVLSGYQTVTSGDGYQAKTGRCQRASSAQAALARVSFQVFDGANVLGESTIVSSTTSYARTTVNFIYPASGTIGWRLISVASNEPIVYYDDLYRGLAEGFNLSQVSQAKFIGTFLIPTTGTCF